MDNKKYVMKVDCPHCDHANSITFRKDINCENCEKSIMGRRKNRATSKISLILTALVSVTAGAIAADRHVSIDEMIVLVGSGTATMVYMSRLSIETEYKIMKTCIDQFGQNKRTRDACFCVVKKLNSYLNPLLLKLKKEEWAIQELKRQYESCTEKGLLTKTKN